MNLYFDLDTGVFCSSPGSRDTVSALSFKRGDTVSLAVRFISGIVVQELGVGATGKLGLKEQGEYDADFVASDAAWTKTGTGTSTVYTFNLNLATSELNALLNDDGTEGNDVASVDLMMEMEWTDGGVTTSSNTITATVHNDVVKGSESGPAEISEGTPVNEAAASVTINPTGADNSVTYTADAAGAAGNDITITYATPAAQSTTTVGVVGDAITVTPGTKARMLVTGTLTSDGSTPVVFTDLLYAGIDEGKAVFSHEATWEFTVNYSVYWVGSKWILRSLSGATWESTDAVATPDLVTTWVPQGAATGTPTVTAATSSAQQVITAVNASGSASALVTAAASGTVTGAVAAVTATSLTGGADVTDGVLGAMKVDADFLYVVCEVTGGVPTWKKIALSAL